MKQKINNINEAIDFLQNQTQINVEIVDYKYRVYDNDFNNPIKDDEALIDYAKEQEEALNGDDLE